MLDSLPDFEKRLTGGFRQSGLPFGFREVVVKNANGRRHGDLVPEKGDIVAANPSGLIRGDH
jgi:hypothetical protein